MRLKVMKNVLKWIVRRFQRAIRAPAFVAEVLEIDEDGTVRPAATNSKS